MDSLCFRYLQFLLSAVFDIVIINVNHTAKGFTRWHSYV